MFNGVRHVHYAVNDLDAMLKYLERNFEMKPDDLWLQLAEDARQVKRKS